MMYPIGYKYSSYLYPIRYILTTSLYPIGYVYDSVLSQGVCRILCERRAHQGIISVTYAHFDTLTGAARC
jgi:hypothetical protein